MSPPSRREPASLHGSLDSFPLADVLALLAATGNTGALAVSGNGTSSRLFVDDGSVVAADGGGDETTVDVVAEMLRLEDGSFSFEPDEVPERPGSPMDVAALLVEARARLDEWYAIEAALPSADHLVTLAPNAPSGSVVLSAEQWRAVAAIAGGGPIGLLLEALADDELEAMRLLKGLVDAGLLEVTDPAAAAATRAGRRTAEDEPPVERPRVPADGPILVVKAAPAPSRRADPQVEARLDALAEQLDVLYEVAQAATATADADEAGEHRSGIFAKLRHRHTG